MVELASAKLLNIPACPPAAKTIIIPSLGPRLGHQRFSRANLPECLLQALQNGADIDRGSQHDGFPANLKLSLPSLHD